MSEENRRQPSRSGANSPENTAKVRNISGTSDAATARIAAGLGSGDTRRAKAKIRLQDWRPDARLERLEQMVAKGEYTLSPGERVELGLYVDARSKAEDASDLLGGD